MQTIIPSSAQIGENVSFERDVIIGENVSIGCNTVIAKGSVIGKGCIIGDNCRIGRYNNIGNYVIVEDNVRTFTRVKLHDSHISQSVTISSECEIAARIDPYIKIGYGSVIMGPSLHVKDHPVTVATFGILITFFQTQNGIYIQSKNKEALNINKLTLKDDPRVYMLAKKLFPENFSVLRKLRNLLSI